MADYKIQNDVLEAGINRKGAELVSLIRRKDGRQYMWSGDAAYWNRVSPVLFPFVGKLNGQRYQYEGKWYEGIGQHAFARDMDFALAGQKDDEIWFRLESSAKTKEMYPFDFTFEIGYRLVENEVQVIWKVYNRSGKVMHFSIGAHPAFLCPEDGTSASGKDGYLLDLHTEAASVESGELTADGVLGAVTKTLPLKNGCLELSDSLFDQDALILNADSIKKASLKSPEYRLIRRSLGSGLRPKKQPRLSALSHGMEDVTGKGLPEIYLSGNTAIHWELGKHLKEVTQSK